MEPGSSDSAKAIRRAAMDLLARREHATVELQRKLLKKFPDYEAIDRELARLATEGLLSDGRFAEAYTRYRANAGFGPLRILAELREKGVRDALSRKAIDAAANNWAERAEVARIKKFGTSPCTASEDKARQIRFLNYRGFNGEHITSLFRAGEVYCAG